MLNVREHSNGESALKYFTEKIEDNGLYLLDEPENSLSPERQLDLKKYIEDAARFFSCQFIIATHSPFLLSIKKASEAAPKPALNLFSMRKFCRLSGWQALSGGAL